MVAVSNFLTVSSTGDYYPTVLKLCSFYQTEIREIHVASGMVRVTFFHFLTADKNCPVPAFVKAFLNLKNNFT